jgi:hypothetical protein
VTASSPGGCGIAPLDDTALDQTLATLIAAEFLYEASVWPRIEYSFKHP